MDHPLVGADRLDQLCLFKTAHNGPNQAGNAQAKFSGQDLPQQDDQPKQEGDVFSLVFVHL